VLAWFQSLLLSQKIHNFLVTAGSAEDDPVRDMAFDLREHSIISEFCDDGRVRRDYDFTGRFGWPG